VSPESVCAVGIVLDSLTLKRRHTHHEPLPFRVPAADGPEGDSCVEGVVWVRSEAASKAVKLPAVIHC
jgi:hypothetical protein